MKRIFQIIKNIGQNYVFEEVETPASKPMAKNREVVLRDICNHCQETIPSNQMICESSICLIRAQKRGGRIKIDMPSASDHYPHPSSAKWVVNK